MYLENILKMQLRKVIRQINEEKFALIYLVQRRASDLANASETAKYTREASLHACSVLIPFPRLLP